jgi:hypothetical protein
MAAFSTALLALSGLATVAQAGASAYGQQRAAKAVRRQGWYEAEQLERNAVLAEEQAKDALARGETGVQQIRGETAQLLGTQRAALAAQGIDIQTGSAAEVQQDTTALGELDILTIRANAAREARGLTFEASQYRTAAAFTRKAAKAQASAYRVDAWSTLLAAAPDVIGAVGGVGRSALSAYKRRGSKYGPWSSGTRTDI